MSLPQRIWVKFFVEEGTDVDPVAFVPVFQRWIQQEAVPGLLIDVVDYKHVPDGPGVMLVGHEVDYGIDFAEGKTGLRHVRKVSRVTERGTFAEEVNAAVLAATTAVDLAEAALGLRFARGHFELVIADRLGVVNSETGLAAIRPNLPFPPETIKRIATDPRQFLTLHITNHLVPA